MASTLPVVFIVVLLGGQGVQADLKVRRYVDANSDETLEA
jgi:hypothetical protein